MKLFKTKEEKATTLLHKRYPQLFKLSKEDTDNIKQHMNECKWEDDYGLYSILSPFHMKLGYRYVLFEDKNRDNYNVDIIRYEYYPDGITIDGIRSPTRKYKFALRIDKKPGEWITIIFDSMDEIHKFIWG